MSKERFENRNDALDICNVPEFQIQDRQEKINELEKENKALYERSRQLQIDKGKLIDENRDLKAQIEKMPKNYDRKIFEFLNSIPALEERLKHGGFIPDKNNKPCKDGDKVKAISILGEKYTGNLVWNLDNFGFELLSDDSFIVKGSCIYTFEKVEE